MVWVHLTNTVKSGNLDVYVCVRDDVSDVSIHFPEPFWDETSSLLCIEIVPENITFGGMTTSTDRNPEDFYILT